MSPLSFVLYFWDFFFLNVKCAINKMCFSYQLSWKKLDFVPQYSKKAKSNHCQSSCVSTWLKLSSALWRLACIPVGGSLVILMEFSKIPCGIKWPSRVEEGSALTNTRKFSWLPSACCSSSFSREPSQRATKWIFCRGYQREQRLQS